MNFHQYGEIKEDPITKREWHQCINCGQVIPVDNNSMQNVYCMKAEADEFTRAHMLFESTSEKGKNNA